MSIGNGAPAWPSVIVSNGGISPSDHRGSACEIPCRSPAPLGTQVELDLALAHGYRSRAGPDDIRIVETWAGSGAVPGARAANGHDRWVRRRGRGVLAAPARRTRVSQGGLRV